jgi:hypothetical protein
VVNLSEILAFVVSTINAKKLLFSNFSFSLNTFEAYVVSTLKKLNIG